MRVQFCDCTLFCFLRFEYDNANQIAKPIRKIGLLSQVLGFARRRWIVYWFTMTLSHGRRWLLWYSSFPCSVTISPVCRLSRPPPARRSPSRNKLAWVLLWIIKSQSKTLHQELLILSASSEWWRDICSSKIWRRKILLLYAISQSRWSPECSIMITVMETLLIYSPIWWWKSHVDCGLAGMASGNWRKQHSLSLWKPWTLINLQRWWMFCWRIEESPECK